MRGLCVFLASSDLHPTVTNYFYVTFA